MKLLCLSVLFLVTTAPGRSQSKYLFQNPELSIEDRVTNILALMTINEKVACFDTKTSVPRFCIPYAGLSEGLHGLVQGGGFGGPVIPTTTFPEVIGHEV